MVPRAPCWVQLAPSTTFCATPLAPTVEVTTPVVGLPVTVVAVGLKTVVGLELPSALFPQPDSVSRTRTGTTATIASGVSLFIVMLFPGGHRLTRRPTVPPML